MRGRESQHEDGEGRVRGRVIMICNFTEIY